jgi:hypothetical protein
MCHSCVPVAFDWCDSGVTVVMMRLMMMCMIMLMIDNDDLGYTNSNSQSAVTVLNAFIVLMSSG